MCLRACVRVRVRVPWTIHWLRNVVKHLIVGRPISVLNVQPGDSSQTAMTLSVTVADSVSDS